MHVLNYKELVSKLSHFAHLIRTMRQALTCCA